MLNTFKEWTQIVGGEGYTTALTKQNGNVFKWGANSHRDNVNVTQIYHGGQLGHGDDKSYRQIPTKVESLDGLVIVKIACGQYHTIAITDDGDAYTWYVS